MSRGKKKDGGRPKGLSVSAPTRLVLEDTYEKYVAWLIEHPKFRTPRTHEKFAEENDVSPRTLWEWRHRPEIIKAVKEKRENLVRDEMPAIIKAAVTSAKIVGKDGAADRRLIFQWLGYGGGESTTIKQNNLTINTGPSVQTDRALAQALASIMLDGVDMEPKQRKALQAKILDSLAPSRTNDLRDLVDADYEVVNGREQRSSDRIPEASSVQEGPPPVGG